MFSLCNLTNFVDASLPWHLQIISCCLVFSRVFLVYVCMFVRLFVCFENPTYTVMAPQNCSSLAVSNWSIKTNVSSHLWLCSLWWMCGGHFVCTVIEWYWVCFVDGTGPIYMDHLHTFITNKCLITSPKESLSCLFCSALFLCILICSFLKISSWTPRSLKMGLIGCPTTSVTFYQSRLCNSPEEQRPHILTGSYHWCTETYMFVLHIFCRFCGHWCCHLKELCWPMRVYVKSCWAASGFVLSLDSQVSGESLCFMIINIYPFYYITVLYHILRIQTYIHTHTHTHTQCFSFINGLYHETVRSSYYMALNSGMISE